MIELAPWLTILTICTLGAMSPGPSLVVVLRHTLGGGRRNGCIAAIAHGLGIGLYAMLCISGLAFLVTRSPAAYLTLQWGGAVYLAWLGFKGITARTPDKAALPEATTTASAARDGFAIAFLNPKVAVFFIALFSLVVGPDTTLTARMVYAGTAMLVDTLWYLLVAWLFSNPRWLSKLQEKSVWLERLFGIVLIGLALRLAWQGLAG